MASTPKSDDVVSLNDSWIDINDNTPSPSDTPLQILTRNNTGPTLQSLEKLLLDAQKESGHSSLKGSLLGGSLPITPDGLQTPPNSLYFNLNNHELNNNNNNNNNNDHRTQLSTDWIWDWSNRDPLAKDWSNLSGGGKKSNRPTFRQWIIRRGILSKEVLSLLFLTNVLSLILGAGIGYTIIVRKAF